MSGEEFQDLAMSHYEELEVLKARESFYDLRLPACEPLFTFLEILQLPLRSI
jgi:hypothetical protein